MSLKQELLDRRARLQAKRAEISSSRRQELAQRLRGKGEDALPAGIIAPRNPAAEVPLSHAQQRLWFLTQLTPDNPSYHVPFAMRSRGPIDVPALQAAITGILERHEILRTVFLQRGGQAVQIVQPPAAFRLRLVDLSRLGSHAAAALVGQHSSKPFDLARGPLISFLLLRLDADTHVLAVNMHHIVSDGWSNRILLRELGTLYHGHLKGEAAALPALEIQYADYALWERQQAESETLQRQYDYWRNKLAPPLPVFDVPCDHPRPAHQSHAGKSHGFDFPDGLGADLAALCRDQKVTLFNAALAAFGALLGHYTRQPEVLIGTPIANRDLPQLAPLIGFFIKPLVIRQDLSGRPDFRTLLWRCRQTLSEAFANKDVPFEKVVELAQPDRRLDQTPLFQVAFTLNQMDEDNRTPSGLSLAPLSPGNRTADYDLSLSLFQRGEHLSGEWVYATDLFEPATVALMADHFLALLQAAVARPDLPVDELPLLSEQARRRYLQAWNDTETALPAFASVHQMFVHQAALRPDEVALTMNGASLTYAALDAKTGRLATHLAERGAGPESPVGICCPRSPELIIGVLAILRAGAAYLPLDPKYPRRRIDFMLEDARPRLVLTLTATAHLFEDSAVPLLDLAEEALYPEGPMTCRVPDPRHIAYTIYTSGSTGRPKGVLIPHQALTNLVRVTQAKMQVTAAARLLQFASINFDAFDWEVFGALTAGARLCMVGEEELTSGPPLQRFLEHQRITHAFLTPAILALLPEADYPHLKILKVGGEAYATDLMRRFARGRTFYNIYGPSEATVFTSCHPCRPEDRRLLLGGPLANIRAYVLDAGARALPPGLPGELYIGGAGLARGYLQRPALTAERFVPDPFALPDNPGTRLYRTGDLVRMVPLDDGSIGALEFLGRTDHQIKLRGQRIELPEIEAVMRGHEAVAQCIVLVHTYAPGDQRLVAFVQPDERQAPTTESLRPYLADRLPEHLVPAAILIMSQLPLLPSGKVDRGRLAGSDLDQLAVGTDLEDYLAPTNPIEEQIAAIWAEELKLERVGIDQNFFELGGHSLLVTRVMYRAQEQFSRELPLKLLFAAPTVQELALAIGHLLEGGHGGFDRLSEEPHRAQLPLSFAQRRLWFLDRMESTPTAKTAYNIPIVLRIHGSLQVAALADAFDALRARHEILRTTISLHEGQPVQIIGEAIPRPLPLVDVVETGQAVDGLVRRQAAHRFDLEKGPLLRICLLRLAPLEHLLLCNMHHIVSDGWSMGIFVRDLSMLYRQCLNRRGMDVAWEPLPPMPSQYADYSRWQHRHITGKVLATQLGYWQHQLQGIPSRLEMLSDRPRPQIQTFNGAVVPVKLDQALQARLQQFCSETETTRFMVLEAVFALLLWRYSRQRDILVGTPVANRGRQEFAQLIGFFVNTLTLRHQIRSDADFLRFVAQAKGTILDALDNQDLPFERLVEEMQPERAMDRSPLFQATFALQEEGGNQGLDLPGLQISGFFGGGAFSAKFDLALDLTRGTHIAGSLTYNTDLYEEATMVRFASHYLRLLAAALDHPDRPLHSLPLLSEDERRRLIEEWNPPLARMATPLPFNLFRQQVRDRPDHQALVIEEEDGTRVFSYRELDRRVAALSTRLAALGIESGTPVAICLEDPVAITVALLAALEVGAVQVLLAPNYPVQRKAYILADSAAAYLITSTAARDEFAAYQGDVLLLDGDIQPSDERPPSARILPDQPIYIIYTSGSTGQPKGVVLPQQAYAEMNRFYVERFLFTPESRAFQTLSYAFDFGFMERTCTLSAGATLVCVPSEFLADPNFFESVLRRQRITTIQATPSFIRAMLLSGVSFAGVLVIHMGGEALSAELTCAVLENAGPQCLVFNGYGPTEAAISSSIHGLGLEEALTFAHTIPIGNGAGNHLLYILDPDGYVCPPGVPGELWIGRQLAHGYLHRPDLTAQRFVPDHLSGEAGSRLYRSGDLVRALVNRSQPPLLEFLGRIDRQIKVRGYRIELGEIEAALRALDPIEQCLVLQSPDKQQLIAYIRTAGGTNDSAAIQAELARHLPGFMVPATYVFVRQFPLTPNGKLDEAALAQMASDRMAETVPDQAFIHQGHVPARTPAEKLLARIWEEVLGLDQVSATANFFQLGGHSLLLTRVMALLGHEEIQIPLRVLFQNPTIQSLARVLSGDRTAAEPPIEAIPRDRQRDFPLSFAQQRLWFLDCLDASPQAKTAYNMPLALHLRGQLNIPALAWALEALTARHESFRTTFTSVAQKPVQHIDDPRPVVLPVVDVGTSPNHARELAARHAVIPFDLQRGPLHHAMLLRFAEDHHLFLFNQHHIISDGWSLDILVREMALLYQAHCRGERTCTLPELAVQYADFALWQNRYLAGDRLQQQVDYWQHQLRWLPELIALPTDRPRPEIQTFSGDAVAITLPTPLFTGLQELSSRTGATLFMICDAVFALLLARYSGQFDIVLGTPTANRDREQLVPLVGFFVNTLVLRHRPQPEQTFSQYLGEVRRMALNAYANSDLPFEKLVELLQPERSLSHAPLFQVIINWQTQEGPSMRLPDLLISPDRPSAVVAKFDLALGLLKSENQLQGSLLFNTDLFDRATIQRMADHLLNLLEAALADPDRPLAALPVLAEAERRRLIEAWNPAPDHRSFELPHASFRRQVIARPDASALVIVAGEHFHAYTYAQLDQEVAALAAHLARRGVACGTPVALCLEDQRAITVGLLATLELGAVLVLLAPAYPAQRKSFILEDTRAPCLLLESGALSEFADYPGQMVLLDEAIPASGSRPLPARFPREQPIYIIYTSGSTGQPKGVVLPHHAFAGMNQYYFELFQLGPDTRVFQTLAYAFDFGFIERISTLTAGGTLVCVPADVLADPTVFDRVIRHQRITTIHATPSLLRAMLLSGVSFQGVRTLHLGGEALTSELACGLLQNAGPQCRVFNGYGPTEATISSSIYGLDLAEAATYPHTIPIGSGAGNHTLYVLDAFGYLCPPGVPGELWIGRQLACGYLRRPDLTAQRFVPDHLSGASGSRLYRSGDLVRALANRGQPPVLEFLGRIDRQVKLRGYRVELGEIETALRSLEHIEQCVVLQSPNKQQLIAAIGTAGAAVLDRSTIRNTLAERLPGYMVPDVFLFVSKFPLTPNGKLDQAALIRLAAQGASPDEPGEEPAPAHERPPRTPTEHLLAEIWAEILQRERIQADAHFFQLGGHSLLLTQVVAKLAERGRRIPLRLMFQFPVLSQLAQAIASGEDEECPIVAIPRAERHRFPLSFGQQRLWFLDEIGENGAATTAYNMPMTLNLHGPLQLAALDWAFEVLIARHESLRTTFCAEEKGPVQIVHPPEPFNLALIDVGAAPAVAARLAADHAARRFDLERGPLLRVAVLRLARDHHLLLLNQHHIISDGWSMGVMSRELSALYRARATGAETEPLPDLPIQYADFALWQHQYLAGERIQRQITYWQHQLKDLPGLIRLPTDRPRPAAQTFRGEAVAVAFPADLAAPMEALSAKTGATPFMIFDAVFSLLLARYSDQDDIAVGTPVASRDRPELAPMIGFFVNTLVLRHRPQPGSSFIEYLSQVKDTAIEAFANADLPFEKLVEIIQPRRNLSHSPLFQVMLAWQTEEEGDFELAGLQLNPFEEGAIHAKFDISLTLTEYRGRVRGALVYNSDLFDRTTIERSADHLQILANEALTNPGMPLKELLVLGEEGRLPTVRRRIPVTNWRGYPLELDQIEAALSGYPGLKRGVVRLRADQLVAYICLEEQAGCHETHLANYLSERLPAYMLPTCYMVLPAIPMDAAGTLQEDALPEPPAQAPKHRPPHSATEKRLASLWCDLLELERVSANADFFELGGHSLQGTRLIFTIRREFGVHLPLQTLFQHPTIAGLARALDELRAGAAADRSPAADFAPLVTIRSEGALAPVFLVHPVGGHVFCYRSLAEALDPHPVYAFQARGVDGTGRPEQRIEAMAEAYVAALQERLPRGRVHLGGWSLGGVIAYEMALRLQRLGREIAPLLLIDSYLPREDNPALDEQAMWLRFALDLGLPVQRLDPAAPVARLVDEVLILARDNRAQLGRLDHERLRALFLVYRTNTAALNAYQPRPGNISARLFHQQACPEHALAQWRTIATLRHESIQGDHYSLMAPPHIDRIARAMKTTWSQPRTEEPS